MVKKATEEHPDMKKRKLIIANKASFTGAFIDEGILNLTGNHKFYILGDKLELILKLLDFKIMNIIGHYTKYGQDFLDNEAFTYIPDIRKLGITDITESEFYKLLELTTDEIKALKYTDEDIEINETIEEPEQSITISKPKRVCKTKTTIESLFSEDTEQKIDSKHINITKKKTIQLKKKNVLKK